jgi:hypothetical protein
VIPAVLIRSAITPALSLLPPRMDSRAARALLVACAFQETHIAHRRQLGNGVGRSYWQFEGKPKQAISGVLGHPASRDLARQLCAALDVEPTTAAVYQAVEYCDTLAAGFARLLLWTDPAPLPLPDEREVAWRYYLRCWNPGLPRKKDWPASWATGWASLA